MASELNLAVLSIIGWVFLIMSWVVPAMMKDKENKNIVGMIFAAVALSFFVSGWIVNYIK